MSAEEAGERIHVQGSAEKRSLGFRGGGALVPEQAEASSFLNMTERPAGYICKEHLHPFAISEADEEGLAEPLGHGSGGAQQGDALKSQPRAHEFPVVEVGREKQRGAGPEAFELDGISGTGRDGGTVPAM